nr:MAG TPA: hypothetical protein [Caudoviricetes sp.]
MRWVIAGTKTMAKVDDFFLSFNIRILTNVTG